MKLVKSVILSAVILFAGCSDDSSVSPRIDEAEKINIISSLGNSINLNGIWKSNCAVAAGLNVKETFDFNNNSLLITIDIYNNGDCGGTPVQTQKIEIDFQSFGEIEALINGKTVRANKIAGKSKELSNGKTEDFKQTFYILEENNAFSLYHGVFSDDGGRLSSDGFPLDLHNVAITKQ